MTTHYQNKIRSPGSMWKKVFQLDKVLHFIVGAGIFAVSGIALPFWAAALTVCAAAVGKELYDASRPDGVFDPADMVATLVGGLVAMAFIMLGPW